MVYALDISNSSANPVAKFSSVASLVNIFVPLLLGLGALLFMVMMFIGGFTYITSGGNAEKVKTAQQTLKFALIGLGLLVISFLIVKLIEIVTGVNIFNPVL